jgi:hypothetical protein
MKSMPINRARWGWFFIPASVFLLVVLTAMNKPPRELFQVGEWTTPIILSTTPYTGTVYSWFPDMAVDDFGSVHIIWCSTQPLANLQMQEQVAYTHLTDSGWSQSNDIVPPSLDIIRNSIAADHNGRVLLLYGGSVHDRVSALYFSSASIADAWSAQAWSPYLQINRGSTYMNDIAVDSQGVIHVIFDDRVMLSSQENEVIYSDIYYRQSTDGGITWSTPMNLSNSPETGSARPYLEVDSQDVIHVTWDESGDYLPGGETIPQYSVYMYSTDGGSSWSTQNIIRYPADTPVQLTVGSTGKGGVMLVWRSKQDQKIFYRWSSDGGVTWSVTPTIHDIYARPWAAPFDMYDMTTDSDGNIHLILVGQLQEGNIMPGIYHLVWNGTQWSLPEEVFQENDLYPEYPKIAISEGNRIHATWFTREGSLWTLSNRQIWYASSLADASHVASPPRPTPTVQAPILSPTPEPSSTPRPTVSSFGINSGSPTKEQDYLQTLAIAIAPVALLIMVVFSINFARKRPK